mgnify:CR=1 FL=1
MNTIFSDNLKKFRQNKNYTQEQVADILGVSSHSVSRWECGTTLPDVLMLPEIAKLYEITTDDLYKKNSVCLRGTNKYDYRFEFRIPNGGCNYETWIDNIRLYGKMMEKAKSLLADPQLSINMVASRLGFNYPNHFTRFFRNTTGMSPSDFRKSL